jgi:hypothetical protein
MGVVVVHQETSLPALVDRAAKALTEARTSAEVLEARDMAAVAYDAAKSVARLAKAKQAHDDILSAIYRAQANALEIEAQAKRRLADEYDAAQARDEVAKADDNLRRGPIEHVSSLGKLTIADVGLKRRDITDGRTIRDAEVAEPGIVRRTIDEAIANGQELSRAKIKRAAFNAVKAAAARQPTQPEKKPKKTTRKDDAELRQNTRTMMFLHASQAHSLSRVADSAIERLKKCKDFPKMIAAARQAAAMWSELANRMERYNG